MSDRLPELLKAFDGSLPLSRARTIPSAWYFDPEIYALECEKVFGNTWQYVGRAELVRAPGTYLTVELAGQPILVVRDEQGTLRAFHNACRHRAAQVINEPCGHATKLRCRYHGWTYDLAGKLRGTPEFAGVEDFDHAEHGLPPMNVETWGPFVFVHQGTPTKKLAEYLAPFPRMTEGLGVGDLRYFDRREYVLECNWKVFVDNYQDGGYHVNTVHPGLAGALDYSQYRTELHEHNTVQISPIKQSDDPAVAKTRAGTHAYYWWIFPNLMINLYQGVMDTNWVMPLGTDRCRVIFDFYFTDIEGEEAKQFNDQSIAVAHQVQLEDWGVCEEVQRGLRCRSYDTGRFSVKREAGGYYFHQLLAQTLRE
ncbi:MAG: aromatic ring-hydroxylating dioxygenase subunit alpha [Planctomycetes bacterium]|nr:aromatic ring-hydroxylating dioxygenase subunit alpha [Planctomycetota bacterium]